MRKHKKIKVSGKKRNIRKILTHLFLKEKPGIGKGELRSIYQYEAETLADGKKILLKRPARLNKGFDFEVHVTDTNFGEKRRNSMPSHKSIFNDLEKKRKNRR